MLGIRMEESSFQRGRLWILPSLQARYLKVLGCLDDLLKDDDVVIELVNNLGVLYALNGDYEPGVKQLIMMMIGVSLLSACVVLMFAVSAASVKRVIS